MAYVIIKNDAANQKIFYQLEQYFDDREIVCLRYNSLMMIDIWHCDVVDGEIYARYPIEDDGSFDFDKPKGNTTFENVVKFWIEWRKQEFKI
jgi:hypothetical protein